MAKQKCSKCSGNKKYQMHYYGGSKWLPCDRCFSTGYEDAPATSKCFIATATYGSPLAAEVMIFSQFRDEILLTSRVGRILVLLYYHFSPPLAEVIERVPVLRITVRKLLLNPILRFLKLAFRR